MLDELQIRINSLQNKVKDLEIEIIKETEKVKELLKQASQLMSKNQSYFLIGIQPGPNSKSYLLTFNGIEVLGEEVIPIDIFIDNVIDYAKFPKKQISILQELVNHLYQINEMMEKKKQM